MLPSGHSGLGGADTRPARAFGVFAATLVGDWAGTEAEGPTTGLNEAMDRKDWKKWWTEH